MADYPDPDEEYELMYADELELLKEQEVSLEPNIARKAPIQAKRSLDFSDHVAKTPTVSNTHSNSFTNDVPLSQSLQPLEEVLTPNNNPNKRTAVELFGDIGDIDFDVDENELPSKRQKTEEEVDLELIDKIIESRKLKQMLSEPSRLQTDIKSNYNVKENVSLNIPRWAFLPVTNKEGDRMYVKLESEESWEHSLETTTSRYSLRQTYEDAWVEARKILEKKEEHQTQQASQQPTQALCEVIQNVDINGNSLWVDKYKPHSYVDLLSDEPVNRALLHWLHLWDKVVFKKEIKSKEHQQRNTFHKRTGQFELTNKWKGKKESEPELDPDGRPHHKVALLCGPPGVGKTTLAHLLAKLAGYRPVELNASDERSTEAFRTALHNATLMTSVLDADRRPNCLVLDEIDGAPLPTIELLVKWCTATATSTEGGKKKKSNPLKRPVIAICNDLYATSLRPLRPVSLIITVGGVSTPRLAARLSLVCESERCKTAPACLSALASRANGDVRAALQILHVAAVMGKQLRMQDVQNLAIGTKDCHKSLLQALTAIFTVNDEDNGAIMKTIQAAGDYDKLADGIFENYFSARVDAQLKIACEVTSWLRTYDLLSSWTYRTQNYTVYGSLPLCLKRCHLLLAQRNPERVRFPTQAAEMYRRQLQLQSIVHSVWRGSTIVSTLSRRALTLDVLPLLPSVLSPTLPHANVQEKVPNLNLRLISRLKLAPAQKNSSLYIVHSVWRGSTIVSTLSRRALTLDVLPLLQSVLSPTLPHANVQLLNEFHRKALETCAGAMCDYGLQYTQQRTPDGLYTTAMEPDIYAVAFFGNADRARPTPPIRQAIAREQQLEMIRRNEEMTTRMSNRKPSTQNKQPPKTSMRPPSVATTSTTEEPVDVKLPNHLQRLQPKAIVKATPQVQKDFFGRIVPLSQVQKSDAIPDVIKSSRVFYQYREGFNNAVRRNVRIKDIL